MQANRVTAPYRARGATFTAQGYTNLPPAKFDAQNGTQRLFSGTSAAAHPSAPATGAGTAAARYSLTDAPAARRGEPAAAAPARWRGEPAAAAPARCDRPRRRGRRRGEPAARPARAGSRGRSHPFGPGPNTRYGYGVSAKPYRPRGVLLGTKPTVRFPCSARRRPGYPVPYTRHARMYAHAGARVRERAPSQGRSLEIGHPRAA